MTYPQQQPYGGQSQYGQTQYGPGYGYGPTAQYGGGGYGPPPPKKNTGAIVAVVAIVVLVLGGLGFTGFVAPGFFLSGDDNQNAGGGTTSTTTTSTTTNKPTSTEPEPSTSGAEKVLDEVVDGLDTQDSDALTELVCEDAKSVVKSAIDDVDELTGAELVDTEEVADDEVLGTVEVTNGSESGEVEVTIAEEDGDWCWQDIDMGGGSSADPAPSSPSSAPSGDGAPTAGGKPVDSGALAAVEAFLGNVNGGDAAAASAQLCSDGIKKPADVEELVAADPDLAVNPEVDGNTTSGQSVQLYLSGTAGGRELTGHSGNVWVTSYDGDWCVHAFRVV